MYRMVATTSRRAHDRFPNYFDLPTHNNGEAPQMLENYMIKPPDTL